MERGEIRYITKRDQYGAEMYATGRPAIIVSNPALAATAPVQQVVYLTKQPKRDLPEHVVIRSTGIRSTAICEQVTTVDNACVGDLVGVCTDEEMLQVGIAIASSLGLGDLAGIAAPQQGHDDYDEGWEQLSRELVHANAELEACRRFIDQLLDRLAAKGA